MENVQESSAQAENVSASAENSSNASIEAMRSEHRAASSSSNHVDDKAEKLQIVSYPLTGVKLEKLGIFFPYFGETTEEFVFKCSGRGDQSWKNMAKRIHDVDTAKGEMLNYIARLYEDFDLDTDYDVGQIIKIVGMIRRELQLPIMEQTQKWYIQQVSNVFLVEKIADKTSNYPKTTGYRFLFKLKP